MKIAILLGAVRKGRQSHRVAQYINNLLKERGVETDLIDLAKLYLPIYGSVEDALSSKNIEIISARLMAANALIFVTPEYHGSFSGVLKNALDHFWVEFQRKPIGVVTTSSGKMGGINASTQLQHVILSMGAYAMPLKLLIPDIRNAFNASFEPANEHIVKMAHNFLEEFLWFAEALQQKKKKEEVA